MVRPLRQNLARCRKVILDEKMDLETQEHWTQLHNKTSQVLNQILKDRQMRDWENRLREIEKIEAFRKEQYSLKPSSRLKDNKLRAVAIQNLQQSRSPGSRFLS
jgi:hypothetical protein